MTDPDRRAYDPFAPPPRTTDPAPAPEEPPPPPNDGLEQLLKADLIALAEQAGLDTSGTKAEIIARLRANTAG